MADSSSSDAQETDVPAFHISCDKSSLNVTLIHAFLSTQSQWAQGIPLATVQRSIDHSLCFGGYIGPAQIAFARVISDYATFANLVDVFVLPEHRGNGYSKRLMQAIVKHPNLQGLRRFTLATSNAHALYAQFGFTSILKPQNFMERFRPSIYASDFPAAAIDS